MSHRGSSLNMEMQVAPFRCCCHVYWMQLNKMGTPWALACPLLPLLCLNPICSAVHAKSASAVKGSKHHRFAPSARQDGARFLLRGLHSFAGSHPSSKFPLCRGVSAGLPSAAMHKFPITSRGPLYTNTQSSSDSNSEARRQLCVRSWIRRQLMLQAETACCKDLHR